MDSLADKFSASAFISAAMAGWRRSLSRRRQRFGPMLPIGMPSLALIVTWLVGVARVGPARDQGL